MEGTKCLEVTQAVLLRNTGNIQRDGQCGHRLEQVLRMAVYEWGCVCFSGLVPTYTVVFFFVSLDWHALLLLLYFVCFFFLLNGSLWLFSFEIVSNSLRPHKL